MPELTPKEIWAGIAKDAEKIGWVSFEGLIYFIGYTAGSDRPLFIPGYRVSCNLETAAENGLLTAWVIAVESYRQTGRLPYSGLSDQEYLAIANRQEYIGSDSHTTPAEKVRALRERYNPWDKLR